MWSTQEFPVEVRKGKGSPVCGQLKNSLWDLLVPPDGGWYGLSLLSSVQPYTLLHPFIPHPRHNWKTGFLMECGKVKRSKVHYFIVKHFALNKLRIYYTVVCGFILMASTIFDWKNCPHSAFGNVKFLKMTNRVLICNAYCFLVQLYNLKETVFGILFEMYKSTTIWVTRFQKRQIKPTRWGPTTCTVVTAWKAYCITIIQQALPLVYMREYY